MTTATGSAAAQTRAGARSEVLAAAVVAVGGGVVGALMSTVNGHLGERGTGPIVAATVSYAVTLVFSTIVFVARRKARSSWRIVRTQGKWWWFGAGLFAPPLVAGFAWGIPWIGVALVAVCTVAGQSVASLTIDAYGIGSKQAAGLTPRRALAGLLALAGLIIAAFGGTEYVGGARTVLVAAVLFVVGAFSVGGQAGAGKIMGEVKDPFITAMVTSTGGFVGITAIVVALWASGALDGLTWPSPWWLYLGGVLGFGAGIANSFAIRHLGTFVLTLMVLGGQMATGLVVDALSPVGVHWTTFAATGVVACAALLVVNKRTPAVTGRVPASSA